MKIEPIVSSETSAIRTQTPGNYPKRNKLHLEHGESLKTLFFLFSWIYLFISFLPFLVQHLFTYLLQVQNVTVSPDHTQTHQTRQDSSGQMLSPTQRPLTTHNTHSRQTSMPPAGFEPGIQASERPQTNALDRAAGHWDRRFHLPCLSLSCSLCGICVTEIDLLVLIFSGSEVTVHSFLTLAPEGMLKHGQW